MNYLVWEYIMKLIVKHLMKKLIFLIERIKEQCEEDWVIDDEY